MRILVVGDSYCPAKHFVSAFATLAESHDVRFMDIVSQPDWTASTPSERSIREYLGTPDQLADVLDGDDVLVVQGAPVTDRVMAANPSLRLICCARGGPVNVDLAAATALGIPVVTTPAKNADAVAELTIALMVMIARRVPEAIRHAESGDPIFHDNYEGADWFGRELGGHTLGVIGYGAIGRRVAARGRSMAMRVLAFDPYVDETSLTNGIALCDLPTLLRSSDFVSIHARLTPDNHGMFSSAEFEAMPRGSYVINTARHELVDEAALLQALATGQLAGAALDVATPSPAVGRHPLLSFPNVMLLPHVGGATYETLRRGAEMAAAEIERFGAGLPLLNRANGAALDRAALTGTT
jgi:D-3-phosphoglycerate dehydrogenase